MEIEPIQSKQLYLRQNIIDAGYDPQDFVEYCSNRHSLENLAEWSLDKLKNIVQLYIQTKVDQKPKSQPIDQTNHQQKPIQKANLDEASTNAKNQRNEQTNFHQTKKCQPAYTEDDWAILFGSNTQALNRNNSSNSQHSNLTDNSLLNNRKPHEKINILNQQLKPPNLEVKQEQQNNPFQSIQKQIPLNPSTLSNQKSQKQQQIKNKSLQDYQKNPNRGPINFTNIKLLTNKLKPLPKLPQINEIIIVKTEQVSRNFLHSDYTMYYINFLPINHVIQRKFAEFRKLRSLLKAMYPHIRLPYIEPEGWLSSSEGKDTEMLAKYKWMIIDFLKYILLRNEELKNCPLVRKFCGFTTNLKATESFESISNYQLKKIIESYEAFAKPKNICDLCLESGSIILPPSNDSQKIISNTIVLLQQIDHEYQKLKKKFESLFYYSDCVAKVMMEISTQFYSLQNLIKKFNFDNDESKDFRVYEGMREMCQKLHNSINQQCVVFKARVRNIFRFQKDNMMTLKQLFQIRNKIHFEYAKQGYPILSKNHQSGIGEVSIQSKIPLDEPARNDRNSLCVQEIFWSHYTKTQIHFYFDQLRKKINQQLTMISYEELDNENDNLNFWNSMIKKCVL